MVLVGCCSLVDTPVANIAALHDVSVWQAYLIQISKGLPESIQLRIRNVFSDDEIQHAYMVDCTFVDQYLPFLS